MAVCWVVTEHSKSVAGERSGMADMRREITETEGEAERRRGKVKNAWRERDITRDAQAVELGKRINARGATHLTEPN